MATRTVLECDLCHTEIAPSTRTYHFAATRWTDDGRIVAAKFDHSEFCSHECVIKAVNGLLNGAA